MPISEASQAQSKISGNARATQEHDQAPAAEEDKNASHLVLEN